MISLEIEIKTELRCNVYNDVTVKEKCCIWCKVKKCSSIIILNLTLFWVTAFLQINYTLRTVFYDVNNAATVIK